MSLRMAVALAYLALLPLLIRVDAAAHRTALLWSPHPGRRVRRI